MSQLHDRKLGIAEIYHGLSALQQHRLLDWTRGRFEDLDTTTLGVSAPCVGFVMTIEARNVQRILAVDSHKWGLGDRRKKSLRPLLGDGIFTTDGLQSAHSRLMLRPNFAKRQFSDLAVFERQFTSWVKKVPGDGTTCDLSRPFFSLTIALAVGFLLGEGTQTLLATEGVEPCAFEEAFDRGQDHTFRLFRLGNWIQRCNPFLDHKKFEDDCRLVHRVLDRSIDDAFASQERASAQNCKPGVDGRYVFLDELVRSTSNRARVRSEVLNVLLAGRDTTASLLTNVWFVLSKRPDVWTRLQAEIETLDHEPPTLEQLGQLRYLNAVLKESLRLHPVVPQNYRQALEDTTLPLGGGADGSAQLNVRKGQVVAWSLYAMHRRRDYYGEDADQFRPGRWLDDPVSGEKGLRLGWEYLPFNGGPRICLGQRYALLQAGYVTVRLCQTFSDIESRDPAPEWREKLHFTCANLSGAKVDLKYRLPK